MKQMEEEDEKEQEELRSRINQLEADVENYNHLLVSWRERYRKLEMDFGKEQRLRKSAENELYPLRNTNSNSTDAIPLPPRTARDHQQNPALQNQQNLQQGQPFPEGLLMGCGKCTKDSRCECIEALASMSCGKCTKDSHCECIAQAFDMNNILPDPSSIPYKRSHSPSSTTDSKRSRYATSNTDAETETIEIDFTTQFSSRPPPLPAPPITTSTSSLPAPAMPDDSCGFCQDGTPCICAEMAADAAKNQVPNSYPKPHPQSSKQSPINNITSNRVCANGPGTCAQCQSSPSSTRFCKSLAAIRPPPLSVPPNLPPLTTHSTPTAPNTTQAIAGPTLSCANAYQTLSQHPAFKQASEELGSWIPELRTVSGAGGGGGRVAPAKGTEGLTAFEVEAASVMGVLRFFDRRFGRG